MHPPPPSGLHVGERENTNEFAFCATCVRSSAERMNSEATARIFLCLEFGQSSPLFLPLQFGILSRDSQLRIWPDFFLPESFMLNPDKANENGDGGCSIRPNRDSFSPRLPFLAFSYLFVGANEQKNCLFQVVRRVRYVRSTFLRGNAVGLYSAFTIQRRSQSQ